MRPLFMLLALCAAAALWVTAQAPGGNAAGARAARVIPPAVQATSEDLGRIKSKSSQISHLVKSLKEQNADPNLATDLAVYAKAGEILLEFPEFLNTQNAIDHAILVLDEGIRQGNKPREASLSSTAAKSQIHAYVSALDGSVQPYHLSLPANFDPQQPARLYVWMHGRQNNTTESEFIFNFMAPKPPGNTPVADQGQIQLDLFGRLNGAGWHWGGEADVFEAIADVKRRFRIDENRILLRGFSMGGEGAWHIALHHPSRFAAAEIGAGTWSNRAVAVTGLTPYQLATLKVWENMEEWALNAFNLPLAAHDGDRDTQVPCLPPPPPGTPNRGQLESSLRIRAQLEKEGFPAEGDPNYLHMKGTPDLFLISKDTGHGTSPLVRQQLDLFLKEWGDKGQSSPDHIRFATYTTRYNQNYWVAVKGLASHYQRAEVDAERTVGGTEFNIKTTNVTRLELREMNLARRLRIDGQDLKVSHSSQINLEKGVIWKVTKAMKQDGLHKTHALQGPIDDAFLDPFLLVRPTGTPWFPAANEQAVRSLGRFERLWAKYFRGHPFEKNDRDVTAADFSRFHVVLFGDPGSNRWIAKMNSKLPIRWTKDSVVLGGRSFPAQENYPALIYPNPLNPSKYVVINTGLTIVDREYNGDYGMPRWGDYAVVRVQPASDVPEVAVAGLFNENWKLRK